MGSETSEESNTVNVARHHDSICVISINRPQRRNAVNRSTAKKLYEEFLNFEADNSLKVCILAGDHGTFCAGADLHEVSKFRPEDTAQMRSFESGSIGPMGPSRLQIKKPVIAAVSGHAVAGGLELSLLGDIRVVEESAIFGVFCRRWGVPLIDGGTVRLQKVIGLGRALDMILTGRPVNAKEALQMGLANRVVPDGTAVDEALAIAQQLLQFPQLCMNVDRNSAYYAAYNADSFEDAMRNEFKKGSKILTVESAKGAAKFSSGAGRHGSFGGGKSTL